MPASLVADAKQWLIDRGAPITAGNLNSAQAFLIDNPDKRPSYATGADLEAAAERKFVGRDTVEQHDLPAMQRMMADAAPASTADTTGGDTGAVEEAGGTNGNRNTPQQAQIDAAIDKQISGGDGNPSMAPAITQDGEGTTSATDDMLTGTEPQERAVQMSPEELSALAPNASPARGKAEGGSSIKNALLGALGGAGVAGAALLMRRRPSAGTRAIQHPPEISGGGAPAASASPQPVEATSGYLNKPPRGEVQTHLERVERNRQQAPKRIEDMRTPFQKQDALEGPQSPDTPFGRQSELEGGRVKSAMRAQKTVAAKKGGKSGKGVPPQFAKKR